MFTPLGTPTWHESSAAPRPVCAPPSVRLQGTPHGTRSMTAFANASALRSESAVFPASAAASQPGSAVSAASETSGQSAPSARRRKVTRLRHWVSALLHGNRSTPSRRTPCASACAVSADGSTCPGCSASTSAPRRRARRARRLELAASNVTSSRVSMRSANPASISASAIGAASRMRPCAAVPASSATARNGSRASADVGSMVAPRPLASRNVPA